MTVSAPMNEAELRNLMYTAQQENMGPFSIRYPRGKGVMTEWKTPLQTVKVGTGRKLTSGSEIAILTIGHPGNFAQEAINELKGSGVSVAHYDMRFVKPIDEGLLHKIFKKFDRILTIEDGCVQGGFGSAILEFMAKHNYSAKFKMLGIPDKFVSHGTQKELYAECFYDEDAIIKSIYKLLDKVSVS